MSSGGLPVVDGYDLLIADLDGVVYLGEQVIPGAVPAFGRLREQGLAVEFATNNASRSARSVAELLSSLGVAAATGEVVTSAQAAAEALAHRLPAGARVLVIGAEALADDVRSAGLEPVRRAEDDPVAVVQGYAREVGWAQLAEGCVAVRAGALWVATNTDRTLPSERGPLPGNGSLVAALATALDRGPDLTVGKPEPALFDLAAQRRSAKRPLVLGDRLDTDIEGANRAGMDSMLVLTGVSTPGDVLQAPPSQRPTYLAEDCSGLFEVAQAVRVPQKLGEPTTAATGGWQLRGDGTAVHLSGDGTLAQALRALCAYYWTADRPGEISAGSPEAAAVLKQAGLAT